MRAVINAIRNIFFTDIIGDITLYSIISSIFKFIFVFIVLYYVYIIVKLIILDIRKIDDVKRRFISTLTVFDDITNETNEYTLENVNSIGRNHSNDIILDDNLVSNFHAEIVNSEGAFYLIDKDSLNGVYLNGELVDDNIELFNNDEIQIGNFILRYKEKEVVGK